MKVLQDGKSNKESEVLMSMAVLQLEHYLLLDVSNSELLGRDVRLRTPQPAKRLILLQVGISTALSSRDKIAACKRNAYLLAAPCRGLGKKMSRALAG